MCQGWGRGRVTLDTRRELVFLILKDVLPVYGFVCGAEKEDGGGVVGFFVGVDGAGGVGHGVGEEDEDEEDEGEEAGTVHCVRVEDGFGGVVGMWWRCGMGFWRL